MKVKTIALKNYKRFTDMTISGLPESTKLVMIAGPNGCGKSSLFDAMNTWRRAQSVGINWDPTYFQKQSATAALNWSQAVQIEFFQAVPREVVAKSIYVRSAYRHEADFQIHQLGKVEPAISDGRLMRLIDSDATVNSNYARIASQGLEDIYESEAEGTTIGEFRLKTIGEIRTRVSNLFPDLHLNSLGNPLTSGTFKFDKGISKGFLYKNLSGGEKAAFDLLLDLIVKKREFNDTVFCIDEPEAHMNTRLQGRLLRELFDLIPGNSQLWLATHSIGMMRHARDLAAAHPTEVVFLDLGDRDFDQQQIIAPVAPTRQFWLKTLNVALDDLAELVAPQQIFICEGAPLGRQGRNTAMDAACYNTVFSGEFPDTQFLSGGNSTDVENDRLALIESIRALVKGARVHRLVDRDDLSPVEVQAKQSQVTVLGRRHLENYLYDDEILTALCVAQGQATVANDLINDKTQFISASVARGNAPDDVKSASGEIYNAAKKRLGLTACGNNSKAFMRDVLSPLLQPGMLVYAELKKDIFGS